MPPFQVVPTIVKHASVFCFFLKKLWKSKDYLYDNNKTVLEEVIVIPVSATIEKPDGTTSKTGVPFHELLSVS